MHIKFLVLAGHACRYVVLPPRSANPQGLFEAVPRPGESLFAAAARAARSVGLEVPVQDWTPAPRWTDSATQPGVWLLVGMMRGPVAESLPVGGAFRLERSEAALHQAWVSPQLFEDGFLRALVEAKLAVDSRQERVPV